MELIIKGEPKEIAGFINQLQIQPNKNINGKQKNEAYDSTIKNKDIVMFRKPYTKEIFTATPVKRDGVLKGTMDFKNIKTNEIFTAVPASLNYNDSSYPDAIMFRKLYTSEFFTVVSVDTDILNKSHKLYNKISECLI